MAFEKFNKDMKIISALDDEPNDVGGLTAAELKAKFDEGGEAIKKYLNETLIPAVVADGATEEHRAEAEAARVAAEQTRQSNEETRQANETSRISAENARNVWENYDASKSYVVGNKAAYGGSSYLCIKPCTGIAPPSAEYWLLIAQKGDKGDKGEPGGGAGQPAVEIDISDKITLSSDDLFTSVASIGNDKSVGEKIKQAALERRANVTVMFKPGNGDPEKVTLTMFGTQSTTGDGPPAYSLTGTYVWAGMLPMDIMIGTILYETDCTIVKRIESVGQKPIYDPVDKPDTTPDGAFLRWSGEQKKWVAESVPTGGGLGAHQFSINDDGDLILTYEGDQPPQYAINNDGDLILTTADGGTINLGRVKGGTDVSLGLTSATVGQTIKVKAVDTDGKPTAWEAVDAAGDETWELIAEIDFDVDAANDVSVWEYKNLPNYKELVYRKVSLVGSTETASGITISINNSFPQYSGIGYAGKGGQYSGCGKILLLPFGWVHVCGPNANSPTNYANGGGTTMYNAIPFDGDGITSVKLSGHATYKIAGGKISLYGRR